MTENDLVEVYSMCRLLMTTSVNLKYFYEYC